MPNNFSARLDKIETAVAARADVGPRLTYPGGDPVVLHLDDEAAIADARAEGRMIWVCDENPPAAGVIN